MNTLKLEFYRQMRFEDAEAFHRRLQGRWIVLDLLFKKIACPEGIQNHGYVSRSG